METVVIALEELAHYAESTARTMPVTGVVPRAVAEDQIRHALRALREKRRRLDASAPDGGARWLLDNLWLCEREGASALAAFHAAGRLRTTCEGALVPALCRVLLASGGGRVDEERIAVFLEGFQRKTPLTGRELSLLGASLRAAVLVRLAQLSPGRDTLRRGGRRIFYSAAAHRLARSGRGAGRGRRRGAHPPARPGGGVPAHGRAQPLGLPRARRNAFAAEK